MQNPCTPTCFAHLEILSKYEVNNPFFVCFICCLDECKFEKADAVSFFLDDHGPGLQVSRKKLRSVLFFFLFNLICNVLFLNRSFKIA